MGTVILGDKERPQVYKIYNDGCVVDCGKGGRGIDPAEIIGE